MKNNEIVEVNKKCEPADLLPSIYVALLNTHVHYEKIYCIIPYANNSDLFWPRPKENYQNI